MIRKRRKNEGGLQNANGLIKHAYAPNAKRNERCANTYTDGGMIWLIID